MEHIFRQWIGMHRAMIAWFHAAHHITKGTGFGGDHVNIYGRIYTELEADFDEIVEKGLGLTGDETLADPVSILSTASNHLAQYPQPTNQDAELIARNALEVARAYIAFIESIYAQFNSSGTMSLGLDDQLQGFANKYETYVYLLQQRSKIISNGMVPMMENQMRLTKSQLKKIIREEYSRLQHQGLIKESMGAIDSSAVAEAATNAYSEGIRKLSDFIQYFLDFWPEYVKGIPMKTIRVELSAQWKLEKAANRRSNKYDNWSAWD